MESTINFEKLNISMEQKIVFFNLLNEHSAIINLLNDIVSLNKDLQDHVFNKASVNDIELLLKKIKRLSDINEYHDKREDILFSYMEKKRPTNMIKIINLDHDDIHKYTNDIYKNLEEINEKNFLEIKEKMNLFIEHLVMDFDNHIYKENNILYPMAINLITDKEEWESIKNKCDEIGYLDI